jgi:hypothetical protein
MKNLIPLLFVVFTLVSTSSCARMSDDQIFRAIRVAGDAAYLAKEVITEK